MIIGETASTQSGGSKAAWIASMFDSLRSFRGIHGLLWYDDWTVGPGGHTDWPIETSASSEQAFRRGLSSRTFLTNTFSRITMAPIMRSIG